MCCSNSAGCKVRACSGSETGQPSSRKAKGREGGDLAQRTEVKGRICKSWRLPGTLDEDPIRLDRCLRDPETR